MMKRKKQSEGNKSFVYPTWSGYQRRSKKDSKVINREPEILNLKETDLKTQTSS